MSTEIPFSELVTIAADLGAQHVAARADRGGDPWRAVADIDNDFETAVRTWQTEAGTAGDDVTVQWAAQVLDLDEDELEPIRDSYLDAARKIAERIAGLAPN